MNYYLNLNDFEEYKNAFRKKIDELDEEIYKLFHACQEVEWVGLGHDRTIDIIYRKIKELEIISKCLGMFLDFMDTVTDDYGNGIDDIKKKLESAENMLEEARLKRGIK